MSPYALLPGMPSPHASSAAGPKMPASSQRYKHTSDIWVEEKELLLPLDRPRGGEASYGSLSPAGKGVAHVPVHRHELLEDDVHCELHVMAGQDQHRMVHKVHERGLQHGLCAGVQGGEDSLHLKEAGEKERLGTSSLLRERGRSAHEPRLLPCHAFTL